jgi:hypothetical protein
MKQKLKSGTEYDAIGKARKYHTWQRGQIKRIKRALNKRFRKEGKQIDKM